MDLYAITWDHTYKELMDVVLDAGEMKPVVAKVGAFYERYGRLPAGPLCLLSLPEVAEGHEANQCQ